MAITLWHCTWICIAFWCCTEAGDIYTHMWAAHIEGGEKIARKVAEKHGFTFLGEVFEDHYGLIHHGVSKRSTTPHTHHHNNLELEPQVKWLEQQKLLSRTKRDVTDDMSSNDAKWNKMWYLHHRNGGPDMNIKSAWRQGYKGQGLVVVVVDDGLERDHPDLKNNYHSDASFDVNDNDNDPTPRYDFTNQNRHGTRCAGVVAAEANNSVCVVGVAFEAKIGGIRMLDGMINDLVEARSLSIKKDYTDIFTVSWGPDDDGKTVDGPGALTKQVIRDAIYNGRDGKGRIFVWSSGNGGRSGDWCSCDGYTNSIYTLAISSVSEYGNIPWYLERCASVLATTHGSGSRLESQIITTDIRKSCTEYHTGTSASSPLAAGIVALTLSANPDLTWRDLQHIVVVTARSDNLTTADWVQNGVGRFVSHYFGFGLMDAGAMTALAKQWKTVPEQNRCEERPSGGHYPQRIEQNQEESFTIQTNGCHNTPSEINYLEHVQLVITLTSSHRGHVQIHLTSPSGTRSTLVGRRPRDMLPGAFRNWEFMTTHCWGESPDGTWTLEIENGPSLATLESWSLVMFGTTSNPLEGQHSVDTALTEAETTTVETSIELRTTVEDNITGKEKGEDTNQTESKNYVIIVGGLVLTISAVAFVLLWKFAL